MFHNHPAYKFSRSINQNYKINPVILMVMTEVTRTDLAEISFFMNTTFMLKKSESIYDREILRWSTNNFS